MLLRGNSPATTLESTRDVSNGVAGVCHRAVGLACGAPAWWIVGVGERGRRPAKKNNPRRSVSRVSPPTVAPRGDRPFVGRSVSQAAQ